MDKENQLLLERITINPDVMVGKPTIRGLRITVEQVLKALSGGLTQNDLFEDYPELEPEDIKAVLLYAGMGCFSSTGGMLLSSGESFLVNS